MVYERPMCLVTIYPDGWVEARHSDDVLVRIHSVPRLRGEASEGDYLRGISPTSLQMAYRDLPAKWRKLVDECTSLETGLPDRLSEDERYGRAMVCALVELAMEADDEEETTG